MGHLRGMFCRRISPPSLLSLHCYAHVGELRIRAPLAPIVSFPARNWTLFFPKGGGGWGCVHGSGPVNPEDGGGPGVPGIEGA